MSLNYTTRRTVLARDQHRCRKCHRARPLDVHHITARQDGGSDDLDNLATLCGPCHMEWHMAESCCRLSFDQWLAIPSYSVLVATYQALPDDLRQSADIAWDVRREG